MNHVILFQLANPTTIAYRWFVPEINCLSSVCLVAVLSRYFLFFHLYVCLYVSTLVYLFIHFQSLIAFLFVYSCVPILVQLLVCYAGYNSYVYQSINEAIIIDMPHP